MVQTIITKHSEVPGKIPQQSDLVKGELAVNLADRRLYTKDADDEVVSLSHTQYEMAICFNGIDADSTIFFRQMPIALSLSSNGGSIAAIGKAVVGDVSYKLMLNGSLIGTINFDAGQTDGVIDIPSVVDILAGDLLTIVSPENIYEMELMSITINFDIT